MRAGTGTPQTMSKELPVESEAMATRVRSHSKINLGLAIGPVRADGFHELVTLYQTLALHDVVTVEARRIRTGGPSKITLTTNHPQVPTDARNTAWKMVELALARAGVTAEVAIHIEKALPVQGGLGAGSANAAAALLGLQHELRLMLLGRLEMAAEVGSDVPLFLVGGSVVGVGHGEQVVAVRDLPQTWCVVAVPEVGVSTPRAFQEWDGLCAAKTGGGLTGDPQPDKLKELSHVYASVFGSNPETELKPDTSGIVRGPNPEFEQGGSGDEVPNIGVTDPDQGSTLNGLAGNALLALVRTGIENDFETVVFPQYPLLREIKRLLMGTSADGASGEISDSSPADSSGNAIYAALSGSGSALFGLYRSEADAKAAQRRVQATGCKALLTETLPRQEYWSKMFAE